MTSKERVHAALERKPTDRVPIYMWFHPGTARRLADLLEIPPARVGEAMGNDVCQTWVNNNYAMEGITHEREGEQHTDFWGITWEKSGPFNQIAHFPLAEATPDQLIAYSFPSGQMDYLLGQMSPLLSSSRDYFLGCDVSPCVFEMYWRLRRMDNVLQEMATDGDLTSTMMGRCADFAVSLAQRACREMPLDWLWTGDDVAGQDALLMSPEMWRDMIKPHLQRVFDVGKESGLWIAYHCCGSLRPIIGDLVDMGLDVLNPIQSRCPGMNALELKQEFGRDLAFMGGIDTIGLLPHGTADEVRKGTADLIEGMTSDCGGYILAASHTVPPETPDENIFAMYSAAGVSKEEIFDRAAGIRRRDQEPGTGGHKNR
jgi:uroporphyrinogen decarboxylase